MPTYKTKLGFFTAAALVALFVVYWALFSAPDRGAAPESFIVPRSDISIADKLKDEGFIRSKLGFGIAKLFYGSPTPGGYDISKGMSAWHVASMLSGDPRFRWVTIPEGVRKEQIADILAETLDWSDEKKANWIENDTAQKFDYLEGVYFPETYLIPADESGLAVANRLIAKFNEKFTPYAPKFSADNVKWTTAVKIASLVQREAAGKEDMPLIAGILWNRLLDGMKLQIDATLQYAKGNAEDGWWPAIKPADKKLDSPYNTYLNKGLPPHPIANPGIDAIEAVLNPAKTDCLYYIHGADRAIHCAETYEEHQKNIEKYL